VSIRAIVFGAHPDDCDIRAGGTAALWARMGHAVKFVSTTNGDAGHHEMPAADLARRRLAESQEAGRRLGVEYDVLDHHDGELLPTLELRREIIALIRQWRADLVIGPRPNDYHPDHRYTGIALQDAAYLVLVPSLVADAAPLKQNPVFLYCEDRFQRPNPFRHDIAVPIDQTVGQKVAALDAHASQFYEWLPWVEGKTAELPAEPAARVEWLRKTRTAPIGPEARTALRRWLGAEKANTARYAESFEICEYGSQPDDARVRELFPMLR
jgi:LmbE family N-acetylglucosaminyl deacetylase